MNSLPVDVYGPLGTALALHGPYMVPMLQLLPELEAYAEDEYIELSTFPYVREGKIVHAITLTVTDPAHRYDRDPVVIEFGPTENAPAPFGEDTVWQQLWLIVRRPVSDDSGMGNAVCQDRALDGLADLPEDYVNRVLVVLSELAEHLQKKLPHAATIILEAKRKRQRADDLADIYGGKTR